MNHINPFVTHVDAYMRGVIKTITYKLFRNCFKYILYSTHYMQVWQRYFCFQYAFWILLAWIFLLLTTYPFLFYVLKFLLCCFLYVASLSLSALGFFLSNPAFEKFHGESSIFRFWKLNIFLTYLGSPPPPPPVSCISKTLPINTEGRRVQ